MARFSIVFFHFLLIPIISSAQIPDPTKQSNAAVEVPQNVDVRPVADDAAIQARLERILEATGWFERPEVQVDEGVVFLNGVADTEEHREWAGQLVGNTQDVVAVVNRIVAAERSVWDISPAWSELRNLSAQAIRQSPLVAIGFLMIAVTWVAARYSVKASRWFLRSRIQSPLLRDIGSRAVAVPVLLLGLYLVLRVSGLTRLALTVIGGTGLLGLVIGFAFRDIAENFLASILIGIQRPFATNDLIEVAGHQGYVQNVNTRSTLLMSIDGNYVQIPNATIYKQTIINFTANPNARYEFTVGIGYADSIPEAQTIALSVLREHPAVVDDPEPLVLVDALGPATVSLRIYFWVNIVKNSPLKVRSAVIRQTKAAFEAAGISMPDEAREVIFPRGVPIQIVSDQKGAANPPAPKPGIRRDIAVQAHTAEGDLTTDAQEIKEQVRRSRTPEGESNLLQS